MTASRTAAVVLGTALALAATTSSCTCQRKENVEAKARLSKPAPPHESLARAEEKIDAGALTDADKLQRVAHMDAIETAIRLQSFVFTSTAELKFGRGDNGVSSQEKTRMVQAENGDFSVDAITGDTSEQHLAYVNDIFFLKNNNGRWRMSRDPTGEREAYRSDAIGVWRSFYDLFEHALIVTKVGPARFGTRDVVKYTLKLPDQSAAANTAAALLPEMPVGPDGGVPEETPQENRKRMRENMSAWRERAKPAGGSGELLVDEDHGVILSVTFDGTLLVSDAKSPAKLEVHIVQTITEVGKKQDVPMPKDAIDDVLRKKMPVNPRQLLEDEKIIAPLPKDAGPAGDKKPKAPGAATPDDEDAP